MNRREFLQSGAGLALGATLGSRAWGETVQTNPPVAMNRKFWTWTSIQTSASEADLKRKYQGYRAHGLTGVFLEGGIDERELNIVKEAGLEIHSWMWTVNRGDKWIRDHHPDWYQVSRTGKSCFDNPPYVDYYRWVSPVIPGVQSYLKEKVDELARHPAISGVHLDYVRYPDVILPRALWSHYHLDQTEELPDYDFCYSEHTRKAFKDFCGRDPLEIKDPAHDQQWLHFRYDSVTALVKQLAGVAHHHRKLITAAVFPTPHMARKICRQDWDKWPLDAAAPMTYHKFYEAEVGWIGDCVLENIQSVKFPIYAGLYMADLGNVDEFSKAIKVALHNGASGVSMFGGLDDAHWGAFEEAINSVTA